MYSETAPGEGLDKSRADVTPYAGVRLDSLANISTDRVNAGAGRAWRYKDRHLYGWLDESWGQAGAACGGAVAEKVEGDRVTVVPLLCGKWSCPICGYLRFRWFVRELKQAARKHGLRYFWTLTIKQGTCSPQESYSEIQKGWNRLRVALARKYGHVEYVWVVEGQKNGMAHLHLVWDKYVDVEWLRAEWEKSFPGSRQVHVEVIDPERGAGYMAKYLGKEMGRALVTAEGVDLTGKHRWGRSRGIDFRPYRVPAKGWDVRWIAFKEYAKFALARGVVSEMEYVGVPSLVLERQVLRKGDASKSPYWLRLEESLVVAFGPLRE